MTAAFFKKAGRRGWEGWKRTRQERERRAVKKDTRRQIQQFRKNRI